MAEERAHAALASDLASLYDAAARAARSARAAAAVSEASAAAAAGTGGLCSSLVFVLIAHGGADAAEDAAAALDHIVAAGPSSAEAVAGTPGAVTALASAARGHAGPGAAGPAARALAGLLPHCPGFADDALAEAVASGGAAAAAASAALRAALGEKRVPVGCVGRALRRALLGVIGAGRSSGGGGVMAGGVAADAAAALSILAAAGEDVSEEIGALDALADAVAALGPAAGHAARALAHTALLSAGHAAAVALRALSPLAAAARGARATGDYVCYDDAPAGGGDGDEPAAATCAFEAMCAVASQGADAATLVAESPEALDALGSRLHPRGEAARAAAWALRDVADAGGGRAARLLAGAPGLLAALARVEWEGDKGVRGASKAAESALAQIERRGGPGVAAAVADARGCCVSTGEALGASDSSECGGDEDGDVGRWGACGGGSGAGSCGDDSASGDGGVGLDAILGTPADVLAEVHPAPEDVFGAPLGPPGGAPAKRRPRAAAAAASLPGWMVPRVAREPGLEAVLPEALRAGGGLAAAAAAAVRDLAAHGSDPVFELAREELL
ncbi:hypothetical protein MNEG_15044 [Monoraphidium neglectum]|uniref:Uncharacterized protein n=1 Tax=Monoraphidium neglectum TaxID=145388 RepID=A0A0D2LM80_9CHLO|nr:hypothetical protein MNEG_15044 [Monoraphidium neglectum]KIY92919.1 hypothetical protein MNEG_15044 [Monoraphidium neglectum]|eukprot:XP_013891939.1 hypothetical protein MNEG_15044 [Monoraphidium neglectum]